MAENKMTYLTPVETLKLRLFLSSFERDIMWYVLSAIENQYDIDREQLRQYSYIDEESTENGTEIFFIFARQFRTFQVPNDHVLWKFFCDWSGAPKI